MAFFQNMMNQYGYWILGAGLMLEVLALPLPGEFLMSYAGLLIFEGKLNWFLCLGAAWLGSSAGITAAYWIGYTVGVPFFQKVGPRIHLGPDKLKKVSVWFDRYGNKMLLIAFYIPGVRHFTGYFAGVTRLPYRTFALYAYTGAFLWTGMFITLGKVLGPQWATYHGTIRKYLVFAGIAAVVALAVVYVVKKKKPDWKEKTLGWIEAAYRRFESSGPVGLIVFVFFLLSLAALGWAVGLVQDLLAHDFSEFDQLAPLIVRSAFDRTWAPRAMEIMQQLSHPFVLAVLALFGIVMLFRRREDRLFQTGFYLFSLGGGILWQIGLRHVFRRVGPDLGFYSFPSEPVMLTVIFTGLTAYFASRSALEWRVRFVFAVASIVACLANGVACIYSGDYYPTDVTAAYAFGGTWICSLIVLFEVSRLIREHRMAV